MPVSIKTLTSNITVNKDMFSTFSLFSFYSILKTLFRHKMRVKICARETRERWHLLPVETEVNGCGLGYSDYDVFLENDEGSRVYRCKKLF